MLTKSSIKLIRSLKQKKYREKNKLFVVEGDKSIQEFLTNGYTPLFLFSTHKMEWGNFECEEITDQQLKEISSLKNPSGALAVFEQKQTTIPSKLNQFYYGLDAIRDPGNLGTLIRLADWYGIEHLFCSEDCVDVYNPKVVQASMGSLARVAVHYVNLPQFLSEFNQDIFGAFMDGEDIYKMKLEPKGILVLGNEGNGVSPEIENLCSKKISIPQFGKEHSTESLNVAIAGAIITSTFYSNL